MYFLLQFMAKVKPELRANVCQILPIFCRNIHQSHARDKSVYGGSPVSGNAVVGVAHISESGPGPGVAMAAAILALSTAFVLTGINEAKTAPRRSATFCKFK